jgi:aldose 1-epimerase
MAPLAPGPLIHLGTSTLSAAIAPQAGGRIAQVTFEGVEQLVGPGDGASAMIGWGCYPRVPWAGRIRRGRFGFRGRQYQLVPNLGGHAIHGVAMGLPWQVEAQSPACLELSLALPEDERWPFGGACHQRIELGVRQLDLRLSVTATRQAMPAVIGWHPWFRKPDRLDFTPTLVYPRDGEGIATCPPVPPVPRPWDDCFDNRDPVRVHRGGQSLRLTSDCQHWVVYDEPLHATCIEPQTGPPDGFNLAPFVLEVGATLEAWFRMEWLPASGSLPAGAAT